MQIQNGNKIILQSITEKDTELIVRWRNNPRVRNNFVFQEEFTNEMHMKWLNTKVALGKVVQFIILTKKEKKPIGSVYLRDIDYANGKAEYGIFIGEDIAIGKGYGTEAAELILDYAFEVLQLSNIFLRVFSDNIIAIQSYKSAGFEETEYRENIIDESGNSRELVFMVCTKSHA